MESFQPDAKDVGVWRKKKRFRTIMVGAGVILAATAIVLLVVFLPDPFRVPTDMKGTVFISVQDAQALENLVILDARDNDVLTDSIVKARHAKWSLFTSGEKSGLVVDSLGQAQNKLRQLGVNRQDPVLVYGEWNDGWGEEGRLYWTLLLFNVTNSYILYGGISAAKTFEQGKWVVNTPPIPISNGKETSSITVLGGDFDRSIRSTKLDIKAILEENDGVGGGTRHLLVDVRRDDEYRAEGHIHGAINWHWKNVFQKNNLKSCERLIESWEEALGVPPPPTPDVSIISSCLGGIRSAFVYSVMASCGYTDVKNYDGSWWDWKG